MVKSGKFLKNEELVFSIKKKKKEKKPHTFTLGNLTASEDCEIGWFQEQRVEKEGKITANYIFPLKNSAP